ncbi:hypothetical protein [Algoriphagus ratkowskyi]|uniref:Uncharacterized protein n=1 Tax=Algoriphagus ratkowskyi TaxID=57028 RepID=A0ABY3HRK5_9BACT|nr:hypothetical protein [Algoriphagus ratkowskyi]TXD78875.1 hypothetical protein ESW18_04980 [Algoriphagus ratkowskyi]
MKEFKKEEADKLITRVQEKSVEILNNLDRESIDVCNFLTSEFNRGDVTKNYFFQFVFRSFYRLDNAGLSAEFKVKYFELMQQNRSLESIDPVPILEALNEILTLKKKNSFQFSFTTKMINLIDPSYPIYDSKVSKAIIGSATSAIGDFDDKLKDYSTRHEVISKTYAYVIERDFFASIFAEFDKSFPGNRLTEFKKLDFIFWSYGKLL